MTDLKKYIYLAAQVCEITFWNANVDSSPYWFLKQSYMPKSVCRPSWSRDLQSGMHSITPHCGETSETGRMRSDLLTGEKLTLNSIGHGLYPTKSFSRAERFARQASLTCSDLIIYLVYMQRRSQQHVTAMPDGIQPLDPIRHSTFSNDPHLVVPVRK